MPDPRKYTEAQRKSAKKWDAANLDRVSIAMPKGKKDDVKSAAAAVGESMNQYIINAIDQRKERDSGPTAPAGDKGISLLPATLKAAQTAAQAAGEAVPVFIARAVETQAQRDALGRKIDRRQS